MVSVGEEADERRERLGQSRRARRSGIRRQGRAAPAMRRFRAAGTAGAVARQVAADARGVAGNLEHQVGIEAEQAVAPARLAAFDRFGTQVTAAGLDQLERRRYRGFDVRRSAAARRPRHGPAPAPRARRLCLRGSPLFGDRRVAGQFGAQLVDELLVDCRPGAAARFGRQLFDQFVAEGRSERLGGSRRPGAPVRSPWVGALDVVQRMIASSRGYPGFRGSSRCSSPSRRGGRVLGRYRLAVGAEFGAAAADRLDAADVRAGSGDRVGEALAALDGLGDRARLARGRPSVLRQAPFGEQVAANLREGRRRGVGDRFHGIDAEFLVLDERRDMAFTSPAA